jgi:hypothetical protein
MSNWGVPLPGSQQHSQSYGPQPAQISEGALTYTTSTDANGRIIYHQFRSVFLPVCFAVHDGVPIAILHIAELSLLGLLISIRLLIMTDHG